MSQVFPGHPVTVITFCAFSDTGKLQQHESYLNKIMNEKRDFSTKGKAEKYRATKFRLKI